MPCKHTHFNGKTIPEHLKEARKKGAQASEEVHGIELSGSLQAGLDAARESLIIALLIFIMNPELLLIFFPSWLIWKGGRATFLAWSRLAKLNRLIKEERYEIAAHREDEKEELTEIYKAKGFSEPLLSQVVEVLMADDNRLLTVMLEEELGLTLERHEHPLKQGLGASIGVLSASFLSYGLIYFGAIFFFVGAGLGLGVIAFIGSTNDRTQRLGAIIWSLSLAFLVTLIAYECTKALQ